MYNGVLYCSIRITHNKEKRNTKNEGNNISKEVGQCS